MATLTIPITVAPDAANRIAELGLDSEFEQMLEHTRQSVVGLRAITVTLECDPELREEPGIVIWSYRDDPGPGDDPTDRLWGEWKVEKFPPKVCQHVCMLTIYGAPANGR